MPQPEARFTYIYAKELYERLRWYVQLRWMAVAGLVLASLLGPLVGMRAAWPNLFLVATIVAFYNVFFHLRLRRRTRRPHPYANLRANAIRQMLMDLLALVATAHFTGGLKSPLLVFFAFHMAIGTIMIATRIMYLLAGFTSLLILDMYLLEGWGTVGFHAMEPGDGPFSMTCAFNMVTLVVSMFCIIYLTDTVTSRFKQRNIEIYRTSERLRNRTAELQRLLKEMEDLERRKSHYMRISAHHLRSPLATVKTSLQVLDHGYVDLASSKGHSLLLGAVERVDGLLAIVNDPDHAVEVVLDENVWSADRWRCHPLINTSTLSISRADIEKMLNRTGHAFRILKVPATTNSGKSG